jgi:hypothetical protein
MIGEPDLVTIIDLLLRGDLRSWAAVLIGTLGPAALGWFGAKKTYQTRPTTHALLGGEGKFAAQDARDVDDLFRTLDRYAQRLDAAAGDPAKVRLAAQKIVGECRELFQLNIAFRTQEDRRVYLDRIKERCGKAKRALNRVQRTLKEAA